jgi:uncharacterized protein (DUF58 family)
MKIEAPPGWRDRLRIWLRPPRQLRPTRAGWAFLLIIMGVGFAALNTGNNLLYLVLSLMLAFLTLSGFLSESALRGVCVRRLPPREIFAEADNRVVLEIHNDQARIPAFALVVEDREEFEGDASRSGAHESKCRPVGRVFALRVGPGRTEARAYPLHPLRRGELRLREFRVSTRFPFGLFLKSRTIEAPESILVYPSLRGWQAGRLFDESNEDGESQGAREGQGSDVSGLREFLPGDSRRRIHWKGSLRRRDLLVRTVEETRNIEIDVHLRTHGIEPGASFEERVSLAASEAVAELESGHRVGLHTGRERLRPAAGRRQRASILTVLARVEPERGDGGDPSDLALGRNS